MDIQTSIFDRVTATASFSIPTKPATQKQWAAQEKAVYEAMRHGGWMTKPAIAFHSGVKEHPISARLSDLKKRGILHERRKAKDGEVYEYRLLAAGRAADDPR